MWDSGLCRGIGDGGLLKRTHTSLSFRTPLLPPLPHHPRISSLWPLWSSSLSLLFTLLQRERERGPREGTMPPFRETVDPTAEQGSLHGGQPTPLPQTSQPSATELYTHTRISRQHHTPSLTVFLSVALFFSSFVSHFPQAPFSVTVAVWRM